MTQVNYNRNIKTYKSGAVMKQGQYQIQKNRGNITIFKSQIIM